MSKKRKNSLSTEEFVKRSKIIHGNLYDYSLVEYLNNKTKVKIVCPKHGAFEQKPIGHLNGNGCKKCVYELKTYTNSDFIKKSNIIHNSFYDYSLVTYINAHTKVKIICPKHGVFEQTPSNHLSGKACSKCSKKYSPSNIEFETYAKEIHGNIYSYDLVNYKNNNEKVKIICPKHGVFEQSPVVHLRGSGCFKCSHIKKSIDFRDSLDIFKEKSKIIHGELYDYSLVKYTNSKTKVKIICPKHGVFEQEPQSHTHGTSCPKCFGIISKQECNIFDFINLYDLKQILRNIRNIISPYELDIFIPDKNIAIEYCGLYWHSEAQGKDKNYHANKLKMCQEKGIRLITIFEDEWIHRQEQVKAKLKSILGVDDREKIFARKCKIIVLTKSQKSKFFEQNHIQGNGPGSITYGLEYEKEIVAAITFIDQKQGKFTLNRYATSKHVVGGFSKLLEHFKRNNEWNEIVTFADLRWSFGELYEKCGFKLDKILKPDYEYVEGKNRIHKFNYRHKNLQKKLKNYDPNLSEKENCDNNNVLRIWDCGKKRYILKNTF